MPNPGIIVPNMGKTLPASRISEAEYREARFKSCFRSGSTQQGEIAKGQSADAEVT